MLVKEIKILLFYYQQREFPCCPLLTTRAWSGSGCLVLCFPFPTCLFLSGLVCMWQNLLKFSILLVGLNVQISHFFQTHYNCLESLRIIVASSFKNNFWNIFYVSKTKEHISETLVWNAVYGFGFFPLLLLLLTCFSYLLCESNSVARNAYCFPIGPVFWLFQQAIFILVGTVSGHVLSMPHYILISHLPLLFLQVWSNLNTKSIWTWCYFKNYFSILSIV